MHWSFFNLSRTYCCKKWSIRYQVCTTFLADIALSCQKLLLQWCAGGQWWNHTFTWMHNNQIVSLQASGWLRQFCIWTENCQNMHVFSNFNCQSCCSQKHIKPCFGNILCKLAHACRGSKYIWMTKVNFLALVDSYNRLNRLILFVSNLLNIHNLVAINMQL